MKKTSQLTLSIVIPCFNAAATLDEAVNSIFKQELTHTYEVIFVDDASTDETGNKIKQWCQRYSHLHAFKHPVNQGGGAARNTGIAHAKGKYIFCLDSDNILGKKTLPIMINFCEINHLDGSAVEERRYFWGDQKHRYSKHWNPVRDTSFTLTDVFNQSSMLLDNFVFTKKSYLKTAGYPTHHGFDTQGFEVRYLVHNNKIRTCPNSVMYHRQRGKTRSYFERVYESGEYSKNIYLICEDIWPQLSSSVQRFIIEFDVFSQTSLSDNLLLALQAKYHNRPGQFFRSTTPTSLKEPLLTWGKAVTAYQQAKPQVALNLWLKLRQQGLNTPLLYWNILRCVVAVNPSLNPTEKQLTSVITSLQPRPQMSILRQPLLALLWKKILSSGLK